MTGDNNSAGISGVCPTYWAEQKIRSDMKIRGLRHKKLCLCNENKTRLVEDRGTKWLEDIAIAFEA